MLLKRYRHPRRRLIFPPGFLALSLFVFVASLCVLKHERARFNVVLELNCARLYTEGNICYPVLSKFKRIQISTSGSRFRTQEIQIDSILVSSRSSVKTQTIFQFNFNDSLPWSHFTGILNLLEKRGYYNFDVSDSAIFAVINTQKLTYPVHCCPQRNIRMCGDPEPCLDKSGNNRKNYALMELEAAEELTQQVICWFYPHFLLLLVFGIISFWKLRYRRD